MGFIHKHTKGDWTVADNRLFPEKISKSVLNEYGNILISDIYRKLNRLEDEANAKLISQAPALLEWAEMLHDQWLCMDKPPSLLRQLQKTIEAAGAEITHKNR